MPYFDHASTSFPKPQAVSDRIHAYLTQFGVSPGRGNYKLALRAEEQVEQARALLAKLLHVSDASHVAFTMNATHALNIVVHGCLAPNSHVLICSYSHNAALRPLEALKQKRGVSYDIVPVDVNGVVDMQCFKERLKANTALFIATGASNVIGVRSKLAEPIAYAKALGVKVLLDATQSLGYTDVPLVDFVVGTGHKTLLGPAGIGFLYVQDPSALSHFIVGGSHGNNSMALEHPEKMPYKFEAGTCNSVGIAGLLGAMEYIDAKGFEAIGQKSMRSLEIIWKELSLLDNIVLYGTDCMADKVPILSFNIKKMIPSQVARILDENYNIAVRAGLHCAPLLHERLGTLPTGTVRVSVGHQNSEEELLLLTSAIRKIAQP